ncbi:unnamed protein product [Allacma fusca]|uniref:Uncharacterized protein n=1 Tax=Allacma fusca TaxID=39272 RepID=A0A8J2NQM5_9HEXA|nr:unnamed protein product [Allacma fusca]
MEQPLTDAEWNKVSSGVSTDEYLNADEQVVTYDESMGDENPEEESESEDDEDDPEVDRNLITTRKALQYIEELKTWYLSQDQELPDFWPTISSVEGFITKQNVASLNHSAIPDFFRPSSST